MKYRTFQPQFWFHHTHRMPFKGTLTRWDPATLEVAK